MVESDEIDHLRRRLNREGGAPLADLSNQAIDALTDKGAAFASWVRQAVDDQPLISLWVAFQIGFSIGRWGPHRAKP